MGLKKLVAVGLTILGCSVAILPAEAVSMEELVGPALAQRLNQEGFVRAIETGKTAPTLMPSTVWAGDLFKKFSQNVDPNIIVETLYLYKKPETANKEGWTDAERSALFNALCSLSSLKGIEYFSASRNKMRIFYESSFVIDDPVTKKPLADPVVQVPPEKAVLYAEQRDSTFGTNIYRYDYYTQPEAFAFVQENLTTMSYGILPLIGKNKLRSVVMVFDTGNSMVIYGVSVMNAVLLPGLQGKILDSFSNRANAIYQWFKTRAALAFNSTANP
jgi:hypothetical protein